MTSSETKPKVLNPAFLRVMYAGFLLLTLYSLWRGDIMTAASNLGIALLFDPFNGVKWEERKLWQKIWLLVHLISVLALFGYSFFIK